MKKIIKTKAPLKLAREHIRLLTPTDLAQVAGGEKPTNNTFSDECSGRTFDTCRVLG